MVNSNTLISDFYSLIKYDKNFKDTHKREYCIALDYVVLNKKLDDDFIRVNIHYLDIEKLIKYQELSDMIIKDIISKSREFNFIDDNEVKKFKELICEYQPITITFYKTNIDIGCNNIQYLLALSRNKKLRVDDANVIEFLYCIKINYSNIDYHDYGIINKNFAVTLFNNFSSQSLMQLYYNILECDNYNCSEMSTSIFKDCITETLAIAGKNKSKLYNVIFDLLNLMEDDYKMKFLWIIINTFLNSLYTNYGEMSNKSLTDILNEKTDLDLDILSQIYNNLIILDKVLSNIPN